MVCVDINVIQHQKALLLYGKTFVNYIYNRDGNIDMLTKGLPSLPNVDVNDDLINTLTDNNSTIEQYSLYLYDDTDKDFGEWLADKKDKNILTNRIIPNIYLSKEQELSLLHNFNIDEIESVDEQELLAFANVYDEEVYDTDKLEKLNNVLNNKLASTILLKKYYANPLTVNSSIDDFISSNELESLSTKNIIDKQC